MLPPAERTQKAFGTRRPPVAMDMTASSDRVARAPDRPAGSLAWALRISAVVGLFAIFATHQLARLSRTDPAPAQLALGGRALPVDPETTGSVTPSGAARATRLDPCLLPALDRQHP